MKIEIARCRTRIALIAIALFLPILATAQGFFGEVNATLESNAGQGVTHSGILFITQPTSQIEYGVRITPASAVAGTALECTQGTPFSTNIAERSYVAGPFTNTSKIKLGLRFVPKADFVGSLTVTFFARNPGSSTDLFNRPIIVSIGQLPAPSMTYPVNNENLACAPAFQGSLTTTYAQQVMYQIEMSGPTNRVVTLPLQSTGSTFNHFTLEDNGYQPGNYSWRVRTLDARGRPGPWSSARNNPIFGGIDMAGSASVSFLTTMRNAGWSTFYAAAWGGHGPWSPSALNLIRASQAGFKVAAYAFLNFDNGSTVAGAPTNQTGQWQVDQGLKALGYNTNKSSLPYDLKYFMIDIENRYQGTMAPEDRVQRIAEAVQHVRNLGFWPMIYTRNEGFNLWWNQYTDSSDEFRELWLWDSKPQLITHVYKDHLTMSNSGPWVPYGGWEVRGGKQYLLDQQIAGGRVDFNVWKPEVWDVNSPDPGAINVIPANVSVIRDVTNDYKVTLTLRNTGTVEAYAIRLGNAQLGSQTITGRQTLGVITPTGSRMGVYTFPMAAGAPGSSALLQFTIWTGNGPQNHEVWVTLP